MGKDTLTVTDNRTGKTFEVPVADGTVRSMDFRQMKVSDDDFGLMCYDPGFSNTASCRSGVSFIDGDRGVLRYRGYSIEQLAERATFLETAYLLINGELPTTAELESFRHEITHHTMVHENVRKFVQGFRYDAHPMGILVSTVGALATYYPESQQVDEAENRRIQIQRLIAKMPTLAAWAYRTRRGMPFVYPDNELSYAGNFLSMLFKMVERKYAPNPIMEKVLDVLFILHADHSQNCSTSTVRVVGSSLSDPYSCIAAGCTALWGPRHGGANEAAVRMLKEIGDPKRVPEYIKRVKAGEFRLMGFGHRVYKNYDPRAKVIKGLAHQLFQEVPKNPLIDVALELERIALEDDYFVQRRLYPNVDFYSGIIYQAMGFPEDIFPVLFAIPRTAGWLAQWQELLVDKEQKIARPRQIYTGSDERTFIPMSER